MCEYELSVCVRLSNLGEGEGEGGSTENESTNGTQTFM